MNRRKRSAGRIFQVLLFGVALGAQGQAVFTGRLRAPRWADAEAPSYDFAAVRVFGSRPGPDNQAIAHRTWEMEPRGWYYLTGGCGNYTLLFSGPSHFIRPLLLTNQFIEDGETLDRVLTPRFDFACFDEGAWDEEPAAEYWQTFVARGTGVTQVGFKPVHDGIDGDGPGSREILVSIHRKTDGPPDRWPQVGPAGRVPGVDCGGMKNRRFSVGWDSGHVPLVPGETYAVRLRAAEPGGTFQMFWRKDDDLSSDVFRIGPGGERGFTGHDLWIAVSTDGDGLLIPCNKKVHVPFREFAGFERTWTQTYAAQGEGLAAVILYAATLGTQPSMNRQRLRIRVHEDGPDGPVVGIPKIAIGNGNYTGDASWGTFGVVFAPGEVPLQPGRVYGIEFTSIESYETLHGFRNIKGEPSPIKPGFNPYRKVPPDAIESGTAYRGGNREEAFDLDLQVIEYEHAPIGNWEEAVEGENLLVNGDMESGAIVSETEEGGVLEGWQPFAVEPGTIHRHVPEGPEGENRVAQVIGGGYRNNKVDGGWVQRVDGLDPDGTYRVSGKIRSTWVIDDKHVAMVGIDPTGQTTDPDAATVLWRRFPAVHGVFVNMLSDPVRPGEQGAISIWLRGKTTQTDNYPFRVDFDDFALHRVAATPPPGR